MVPRDAQDHHHKTSEQAEQDTTDISTPKRQKKPRQWAKNITRGLLILLFGSTLFLSVFPQGRAMVRTVEMLPSLIAAQETFPLTLVGEPIQHTQMTIMASSGPVYLDVYAPTTPPPPFPGTRGGMLIIPGVGDNRQVDQVVNLSSSLAYGGLVVMTMTTPALINYDLSVQDSDATVEAFKALTRIKGVDAHHIGIFAISGGAPLACFAAADTRIRDLVAYVAIFGGYFNTTNLLRDFGRRALIVNGKAEVWQPVAVPVQVLTNVMITAFSLDEQVLIKNATATNTALTDNNLASLSLGALAAYHLLMGDQSTQVDANIARLPSILQAKLTALAPSTALPQLRAPIFLLHDRHDTILPFTETQDFATALERLHHPHDYISLNIFDHVEVRAHSDLGPLLGDSLHLFNMLNQIVQLSS